MSLVHTFIRTFSHQTRNIEPTFGGCWPASQTVFQHPPNVGSRSHICFDPHPALNLLIPKHIKECISHIESCLFQIHTFTSLVSAALYQASLPWCTPLSAKHTTRMRARLGTRRQMRKSPTQRPTWHVSRDTRQKCKIWEWSRCLLRSRTSSCWHILAMIK